MKRLFSLLLALAMLLSLACAAESSAAMEPAVVTIRDAEIRYDGAVYPLNPAITLGAAVVDDALLIDFGMPLGEDVLFPVQIKLAETGMGLLMGKSTTAYTFTPEFMKELLGGEDIFAELQELLDAEGELLGAAERLENFQLTPEQNEQITNEVIEMLDDYTVYENVTQTIDGQDCTGERITFTIDPEEMSQIIDKVYSYMPEEYVEAYIKSMSMTCGEMDSMGDLFSTVGLEMSVEADLFAYDIHTKGDILLTMTIDPEVMMTAMENESVGIIGGADGPTSIIISKPVSAVEVIASADENADTEAGEETIAEIGGADGPTSAIVSKPVSAAAIVNAGKEDAEAEEEPAGYFITPDGTVSTVNSDGTLSAHIAAVEEIEPITMTMPMHLSVTQESETKSNVVLTGTMGIPGEDMSADMRVEAVADGQAMDMTMIMTMNDSVDNVTMTMDMVTNPADENAHDYFGMHVTDGEMIISISVDSQAHESGSTTSIDFNAVAPEAGDEFIDFGASFVIDESHPVIASRFDGAEVSTISTLEEAENATGLAMAAMGMMGDVEKLMNDESIMALVELFSANLTAEADVGVSVQAADNTRPLPEFAWLPEGFAMAEDESYAYDSYITVNFYDDSYNGISIYMYDNYTAYDLKAEHAHYILKDGEAQPANGPTVHIIHAVDDYGYASTETTTQLDNWNVTMSSYGVDLTDEEIIQLLSGISFPEAEEETAEVETVPAA